MTRNTKLGLLAALVALVGGTALLFGLDTFIRVAQVTILFTILASVLGCILVAAFGDRVR